MNNEINHSNIPTWIIMIVLIVSIIGFSDASYLTAKHFSGEAPECSILHGCEIVTSSSYSEIFGIPVALLGTLYYLFIFLVTLWYKDSQHELYPRFFPWISVLGLLASLWFVYLQLFVIKAICQYCMLSAITSTLIFILGMVMLSKTRKSQENIENSIDAV